MIALKEVVMRVKTKLFVVLMLCGQVIWSQVGPFTNNTLNTASAEIAGKQDLEMQFAPEYYVSKKVFDENGKIVSVTPGVVESGASIQFNNGITEKLEWGIGLPTDISELSLGLKYQLANFNDKALIAIATWTDIATASRGDLISKDTNPDNVPLVGLGTAFQYGIADNMNLYFDLFGQKHISGVLPKHALNLYANLDFDYAINDGLRLATGIAFQSGSYTEVNENNQLGSLSVGVFFEKWENWSLYLANYSDVFGKNIEAGNTLTFNVTRVF